MAQDVETSKIFWLSRLAATIGLIGLLMLAFAAVCDVVMRWLFSSPIYGLSDLSELVTPAIVASCFPATIAMRQNITIRFLGASLPARGGQAVELFGQLVTVLVLAAITWEVGRYSLNSFNNMQTTWLLRLPVWPGWFLTTGLMAMCVPIQLGEFFKTWNDLRTGNPLGAPDAT